MILGTLHLDRKPQPKQRARTVEVGEEKHITYTPPATVAYERLIGMSWRGPRLFTGAVKVTVAVIEGRTAHPGDLDNYVKVVLDGLQGVAFVNDKQVVGIAASIIRGDSRPGLDVIVEGWDAPAAPPSAAPRPVALGQLRRGRGR